MASREVVRRKVATGSPHASHIGAGQVQPSRPEPRTEVEAHATPRMGPPLLAIEAA